jgi:hypothetical protein
LSGIKKIEFKLNYCFKIIFFINLFSILSFAACLPVDLNGDCFIDYNDIEIIASRWLDDCNPSNEWCERADINHDYITNFVDFALFASYWSGITAKPECPKSDVTDDCIVDMDDFAIYNEKWLDECDISNCWCEKADLNKDGIINFSDYTVLLSEMNEFVGNTAIICPSDNIQKKYDRLKLSALDDKMGKLSAENRRTLLLSPGTYNINYTVLMDTDYIDILPQDNNNSINIIKSGNSIGIVLLPNVRAVNLTNADDRKYVGRFNRASGAFTEFDTYDVDEIITQPIPLMGFVKNPSESTKDVTNGILNLQYKSDTTLFASAYSDNEIYKSIDGNTWCSAGENAPPLRVKSMWASDSFGNCIISSDEWLTPVYYGTYDINTTKLSFTQSRNNNNNSGFTVVASATLDNFNFIKLSSGTLLLSEYGILGRYIYRSTDNGHSWSYAYDSKFSITHWHCFGQLASTGRVVAFSGDSTKAKAVYSDDDGLIWTELYASGTKIGQPINCLDIGHKSKLLCADDGTEGLYLFDVYSGKITSIFNNQVRQQFKGYFWSLLKEGDTIYASTYVSVKDANMCHLIYASDDLVNWSGVYCVSSTPSYGIGKLIYFKGALHGNVAANGVTHLKITPPPISKKQTGVLCEQPVVNQLDTVGRSSGEDANFAEYFTSDGIVTKAQESNGIRVPHGDYAIRVTKPSTSATFYPTIVSSSSGINVSAGEIYTGSVMIGVPSNGAATIFNVNWIKSKYVDAANAANSGGPIYATVYPGEWKTIYMPPIEVSSADNNSLGLLVRASVYTGTIDFLVDEVQICNANNQPSSWQVGGTPRAKCTYDIDWTTNAKATHIFSFCPFARADEYKIYNRNFFIRSYMVNPDVYAELYYDAGDSKFKLAVTENENTEILATSVQNFRKGVPIIFVVQFGDDNDLEPHLSIGNGRAIETVNGKNELTSFNSTNVLVRWGDKDSNNGFNGTLYDLDFIGMLAPDRIVDYVGNEIEQSN